MLQNLLRTLTESQAKSAFPDVDFRILLSTVKEGRRQSYDAKLSDPFYDSLEGLLQDLKTITPDNRDAEAFLKPVSRADVPDYYDVIANPMDLQTMLKKVKQKQYKSKREFQDDLDLIWSNCFTYNAAENHPLRQCTKRLKVKAESLLRNITDRKERTDPVIPPELGHSQSVLPPSGPMPVKIRINGSGPGTHLTNGAINGRSRRSSIPTSVNNVHHTLHHTTPPCMRRSPTTANARPRPSGSKASAPMLARSTTSLRRDIPFPESPALIRTQEGMSAFLTIDKELDQILRNRNSKTSKDELMERLIELAPPFDYCESMEDESFIPVIKTEPDSVDGLVAEIGDKRKFTDQLQNQQRPRKRARFSLSSGFSPGCQQPTTLPLPLSFASVDPLARDKDESIELSELWWGAVQSDALLANGLPCIRVPSSTHCARMAVESPRLSPPLTVSCLPARTGKPKSRHKLKRLKLESRKIESSPTSLLSMMNTNMKTMKRVRHTHARFAALTANTATAGLAGADEPMEVSAAPMSAQAVMDGFINTPSGLAGLSSSGNVSTGNVVGDEESIDVVDDKVDERPWLQRYIDGAQIQDDSSSTAIVSSVRPANQSNTVTSKGYPLLADAKWKEKPAKGKRRSKLPIGIDMGEEIAENCARWMGEKVLEHVGFQGTSKAALDVLSGVTMEYLYNVGRTIKFLSDKYSQTMTPEEIILHTLFESGASKIQDLERYITDDVRRHGTRLGELEKKLVGAYRESTTNEAEDEGLFESEEEDEAGALAIGDFADVLGEDYLGLRELGIAAEFGISSLTIPKKLLRSKKPQKASGNTSKPAEPPPPFPPPPSFIQLTSGKVDDQIGLLKPYYQSRFTVLASSPKSTVPGPPLPGPPGSSRHSGIAAQDTLQGGQASPAAPGSSSEAPIPPDLVLPDDPPNPGQVKMGPLGQIIRGTTSGSGKKKAKTAQSVGPPPGTGGPGPSSGWPGGSADTPTSTDGNSPKKKKGATGVGTGNGRKKKAETGPGTGPAEMNQSNPGFGQTQNRPNQGKGVVFPAVVVASA
ncbi:hypothetical protein AX17_003221 [Amanita inopinata Kibby_2008]|nr:hypothetical protein AX17_003221 [Amanita inopinata Kibby_2008]